MTTIAGVLALLVLPLTTYGQDSPSTITLKHIEQQDVVYTLHQGPYWELGKVYARIGELMAEQGQTGRMFARYLDDPSKVEPSALRIEVGFFADGDVETRPPFQRKTLAARTSASLVIAGPYGLAPKYHKQVYEWIESNGYTAVGHAMETFRLGATHEPSLEIQIPIQEVERPSELNTPTVPTPPVESPNEAPAAKPIELNIRELVSQKAYERVADELIPPEDNFPAVHRKWFADVTDRLRVVRELVNMKYGSDAADVDPLITPIVQHSAWLRRGPVPALPSARLFEPPDAKDVARRKTEVLRDLDRLMARTHLKKLSPDEIVAELTAILERVSSIIRADTDSRNAIHGSPRRQTDQGGNERP
ncbi:MAG: GyrI-like domain-containing protein [Planctomycetes bacterium]|nr:GyrI-like domain-containing protein [Planctomycetota bacterium]